MAMPIKTRFKIEIRGGIKPFAWTGNCQINSDGAMSEGCYEHADASCDNVGYDCWGMPKFNDECQQVTDQIWKMEDLPSYGGNIDDGSPCYEPARLDTLDMKKNRGI